MSGIIRLRKTLTGDMPDPVWRAGFRQLEPGVADPAVLHAILADAYANGFGGVPGFEDWWTVLAGDPEFDPSLLIVAATGEGMPVGLVQCWTSAFVKDIAVMPAWRGAGIGQALMLTAFHAFRLRGAEHVDLKVVAGNDSAIRLYHGLGMVDVPF
jgi:ribosomal protein S18 acetylase RimI-like enzyme